MNKEFSGKIVVVTGGAWGIGKNIASLFARRGGQVVICYHSPDHGIKAKEWFQSQNLLVDSIECDLSKKRSTQNLIGKVILRYKKIDVLVNNAKYVDKVNFLEESDKSWDGGISVSLEAAFFASVEAMRYMRKQNGGNIINISSVEGFLVGYDSAVYQIAKAGLINMTRYLALHAGKFGIRVNCIAPGLIIKDERMDRYMNTDNIDYRKRVEFVHPIGRPGYSDDIAQAVLFLAGSQAKFITGVCLPVDGGLTIQEPNGLIHHV